jgi:hypothetical protein
VNYSNQVGNEQEQYSNGTRRSLIQRVSKTYRISNMIETRFINGRDISQGLPPKAELVSVN